MKKIRNYNDMKTIPCLGFSDSSVSKESAWVGKIHWRSYRLPTPVFLGFPCGSAGKEFTCNAEDWVQSMGWEDPLKKGKATRSSFRAWRIPWTVYSPLEKAMVPHSSALAWKIPRTEEPGRLQSMGSLRVRHD